MKLERLLYIINQQLAARLQTADLIEKGQIELANVQKTNIEIQCGGDLICHTQNLLDIVNWQLTPDPEMGGPGSQFNQIMEMEINL